VVIIVSGPAEDSWTYLVEPYSGSAIAHAWRRAVSIEDSCAQALGDLMYEDFIALGLENGAFTHGHGCLYARSTASIPQVRDGD
jgi:hypothetical protein